MKLIAHTDEVAVVLFQRCPCQGKIREGSNIECRKGDRESSQAGYERLENINRR